MRTYSKVKVWEERISLPTYKIGEPDKNPMFLEKRVYQGSSGKVYPHTVIDKIYDEKEEKEYTAVFLENDFIRVMVLPELGGRIQRATDKTNGYDFVYYNHVVKPALVGLAGPWISGGIEFNWPQHHRPSTFDPVDYSFRENEDGSATVTVGEIEVMFRTKGLANFTVYPDSTYIEIKAQLYNRTDVPQTFLWWANPAVAVNEKTRSIFPPDVTAVMDHGKRDVSTFPIATGTYYKVDYSAGVDISRYKNLPVPTSYMAAKSDYDFVGGYDDGLQAGLLHVADHHISPGKKQWTWGCGEFGKAWDRNLTDEDGPYVELMTGCFTDNQPDFSWLAPMEERRFTQYFMPYQKLGTVHNATKDVALHIENGKAAVYATGNAGELTVRLYADTEGNGTAGRACREAVSGNAQEASGNPDAPAVQTAADYTEYKISLAPTDYRELEMEGKSVRRAELYKNGRLYLAYETGGKGQELPEAAVRPPKPEDCATNEDLFLYGLHLEQYRHATANPDEYYLEGLRRDAGDVRINNAYGLRLLKQGLFAESEQHFRAAVERITRSNPNPYDSEPYYNLGLALLYQGKEDEAYDAFYKSAWSSACQEAAFYHMACICCRRGDFEAAAEHAENAVIKNARNYKARNLKTYVLEKLGRKQAAEQEARAILEADPLNYEAKEFLGISYTCSDNTAIELALAYENFGAYKEAEHILIRQESTYPLVWYHLAQVYDRMGQEGEAAAARKKARGLSAAGCFPHRLEDEQALREAVSQIRKDAGKDSGSLAGQKALSGNAAGSETASKGSKCDAVLEGSETIPECGMDFYYLGNLYYDKRRYDEAVDCFEQCCRLQPDFPTAHRNLALAYYNKRNDAARAVEEMERAFALDRTDMRVLLELDLLYKNTGVSPERRLEYLMPYEKELEYRDDLYLEYVTLLNSVGQTEKAYAELMRHNFHPWEGGEGKAPAQYIASLCRLAKQALENGKAEKAGELLQQTLTYPQNLGEGKLYGAQENLQYYLMGLAYAAGQESGKSQECFRKASLGLSEPKSAMYYNDQPPETIFCQGLALLALGEEAEAEKRFDKLIDYADAHENDEVTIDYFAVSLPDFLVLDADLNRQNKVHCKFMRGLGLLGQAKGQSCKENTQSGHAQSGKMQSGQEKRNAAAEQFKQALQLNPSHFGVLLYTALFMKQ